MKSHFSDGARGGAGASPCTVSPLRCFPVSTRLLCLNKTCKNRKSSFLGLKRACEGFLYKENSGMCFSVDFLKPILQFTFFALLSILSYGPNYFIQQNILNTHHQPGTVFHTQDAETESEIFSISGSSSSN